MYDSPSNPSNNSSPSNLVYLVLLFLTLAVGFLLSERFARRRVSPAQVARTVTPRGDLSNAEKSTIDLFQNSSQSVVYIQSLSLVREGYRFSEVTARQRGSGTGFVWNEDGHIVTNFHVIANSEAFLVTFADQTRVQAKLVGRAEHKDLALLKVDVDPSSLRPISIGESNNLLVGQHVFAIGNPFGLDQTLTTGVISGLGREIKSMSSRRITDVIQTDAAINPGNSGGPLLDSAGRLIGVNTQIVSASGASDGIGFAIPVDTLQRVIPQLIAHGKVITPSLGVRTLDPSQLVGGEDVSGVLVVDTLEGSPAANAGIQPLRYNRQGNIYGDLIVGLGDQQIENIDDLYLALEKHSVGESVKLHVVRGLGSRQTKQLSLDVTLGSLEN